MRKSFVKRLTTAALALSVAAMALAAPAFADDERKNIVTYSPGMQGASISDDYVNSLEAQGYEARKSAATGAVAIRFGLDASEPAAPSAAQISYDSSKYFIVDTAADVAGSSQRSKEYVVEYAALSDGALDYTVEYRDRDTNAEVAPAEKGRANLGATLTRSPVAVANYRAESAASATLTITAGGGNLLTFYYVAVPVTETTTVTDDGDTIYRYNDVTVYSTAGIAPAGGGATGGGAGGEVINPDETPLAGDETGGQSSSGSTSSQPTEELEPDSTPQTNAPGQTKAGISPMVGVGAGLVALLLAIAFFLKRKKDSAGEE